MRADGQTYRQADRNASHSYWVRMIVTEAFNAKALADHKNLDRYFGICVLKVYFALTVMS